MSEDILINLQNVYKIYKTGETEVHALDGVTLAISRGEFVAIVGASGSGKTTCMNIIGCLDVPTSGSYHLAGEDVLAMDDNAKAKLRNKTLGFIFQQYNLIPKLNLCENVGSSSVWLLPEPWPENRRSFWQTSPPALWIARPVGRY